MSGPRVDDDFRMVLTGEHPGLSRVPEPLRHLPSDPRCKLCLAPFGGLAARSSSTSGSGASG